MKRSNIVAIVLALLFTASCSAITDPGRFNFDAPPSLNLDLRNFEAYADGQIEFRVVEEADPSVPGDTAQLVLRGILEGLDEEGVSPDGDDNASHLALRFPGLIEQYDQLSVRVFVDLNFDGIYNPPDEPGWQEGVVNGAVTIDGSAVVTGFDVAPAPPGNFELDVTGMTPHVAGTQHVAAMLIDVEDGVPVAYWRIADLDDPDFTIFIQEVLEPDSSYDLEMYADFTQDGSFTPLSEPDFDHAWFREYESDGDGDVVESFAHTAMFEELSYF
jgi:hypothetical protein